MSHRCYWFDTCPTRVNVGVGVVKNADILIIGGGIAGMSLLVHLLKAGYQNTYVLDESHVGYHASGRSSGQLMLRGRDYFVDLEKQIGKEKTLEYIRFVGRNLRTFSKALGTARFDTNLEVGGGLRLASNDEEMELLERESSLIREANIRTNPVLLSRTEIESLVPSNKFAGGLYIPTEATINPFKVISGMLNTIEGGNGQRVFTGCLVESVERNADGSFSVFIRHKGVIKAKKIVYSMNAYTPGLVPELSPFMTPFRGQMIATDVLPDSTIQAFPQMSMSSNYGREYFRVHGSRLLLGGMRQAVRGKQEGLLNDGEISRAVYNRLKEMLVSTFPFIDPQSVTHSWAGIMCSTRDGLPIVGPLEHRPGEYMMAGFNGYGFSQAFSASAIITDYINKNKSSLSGANLLAPSRFLS